MENRSRRLLRLAFWAVCLGLLFRLYTLGLSRNPPGFYVDESAPAYNAYLVAHTGAGEFGPRFPLYFQYYTGGFVQVADPVQVYMLAVLFRFFPPSIYLARMFSAFWVFLACLLLGLLARRISGRRTVGVIVAGIALLTPWFFEGRGLLLEPQFVPMALAPFLLVVYRVQQKEAWSWGEALLIAATLALITYCYTSGRLLGPLLAAGLLIFATSRQRLFSVIKAGFLYGLTIVPILIFNRLNPGVLTKRLNEISYLKSGAPLSEVFTKFIKRYLEDQSLTGLLLVGDYHPRHHVQGSGGEIFFATFFLALLGLGIVIAHRRSDPWWRFILYGLLVSVIPGAISTEPFHAMRLMAYPVFLIVLTVPALEWLLARHTSRSDMPVTSNDDRGASPQDEEAPAEPVVAQDVFPRGVRICFLLLLLALTAVEAYRFQTIFRRAGPSRSFEFDVPYKVVYDAAVRQPSRPIYLEDGKWGPGYIHALWYATVEGRPTSQFVHLAPGARPPAGAIVISSSESCQGCEPIANAGVYRLYKAL